MEIVVGATVAAVVSAVMVLLLGRLRAGAGGVAVSGPAVAPGPVRKRAEVSKATATAEPAVGGAAGGAVRADAPLADGAAPDAGRDALRRQLAAPPAGAARHGG